MAGLQAFQISYQELWPKRSALYNAGTPDIPHKYQVGDWIYVKRHHAENLEAKWKGPFLVLLTTLTSAEVDGVTAGVHVTHIRPVLAPDTNWIAARHQDNLLKLKITVLLQGQRTMKLLCCIFLPTEPQHTYPRHTHTHTQINK